MRRTHCNSLRGGPGFASPKTPPSIPSYIDTALVKPRSGLSPHATVRQMADDMRSAAWREGGITEDDLEQLGYTRAQIKTHGADARAMAQQLAGAAL